MPAPSALLLFGAAAMALLLVPGPSVLFIVARSVEHGRRAGFISVLGIHAGSLVHVFAATVGLSAVLVSSALAFTAVKYAGAAYLIWLGVRRWRSGQSAFDGRRAVAPVPARTLLRQWFVVNVLNPKTAIFFLAFLPQFVSVERGHAPVQVLVFGLLFILLGLVSDSCYSLLAARLGGWLKRRPRAARAEPYVSGTVYVGLGVATATQR